MACSIRLFAFLCLIVGTPNAVLAQRTFTVDDMLALEGIGRARFDPSGDLLIFERFGRFDRQASYGRQYVLGETRSRIHVADLRSAGAPAPLFDQDEEAGYLFGRLAPDGRSILVSRVSEDGFSTGLVAFDDRRFRPFALHPRYDPIGQIPWSGSRLIVASRPEGDLDLNFAIGTERVEQVAELWRARNQGQVVTGRRVGSGRFAAMPERGGALAIVDTDDGSIVTLAEGHYSSWDISADGEAVAALREQRLALDPNQLMEHGANAGGFSRSIVLLDPRAPGAAPADICPNCDVLAGSANWSPSGQLLAFFARTEGTTWASATYRVYDRRGGNLREIDLGDVGAFDERERVQIRMTSAWIGDDLAILAASRRPVADASGRGRADWYIADGSEIRNLTAGFSGSTPELIAPARDALVLLHDGEAWLVDRSGHRRNLTADVSQRVRGWRAPTGFGPAPAEGSRPADTIILEALHPETLTPVRLLLLDLATGGIRSIDAPSLDSQFIAVSAPNGRAAVLDRQGNITTLRVLSVEGMDVEVARINEHLRGVVEGTPVRIDHQGPGGDARISWLLLPPNHRPGQPVPTIVNVYPGNVGRETWRRWRLDTLNPLNDQILAGRGYAILYPSLPVRYEQVPREPLEGLAREVLAAVDAAVARGLVDPDRIAVQGQSYGGYAAGAIIGQTDRFRSAVATAGIYNLISSYGEFDIRMRLDIETTGIGMFGVSHLETSQGGMGAPPWVDPQRYLRNSPLMHVASINTPIMLVTPDLDFVSTTQSEQMFTALTRLNKDAEFVRYFGEDHILNSPANIRDLWRRIFDWYDATLQPR